MGLAGLLLIWWITDVNHPGKSASASQNASAATNEVAVREGLLSVELRDAPLAHVLLAIGAQAGFDNGAGADTFILDRYSSSGSLEASHVATGFVIGNRIV
jgi:hypothetical protein